MCSFPRPLWKTRIVLTSSSSSFSSCEVAVFLSSLSSCSQLTQDPCPCQDWKNPLFSRSHTFASSRSWLWASHHSQEQQSRAVAVASTATPACPCHLWQCQPRPGPSRGHLTLLCRSVWHQCWVSQVCPSSARPVLCQGHGHHILSQPAQLCPQGAHPLLGFQCHPLLQPQCRTRPWSPHTWLCPLGSEAWHQIAALVSPPGSSAGTSTVAVAAPPFPGTQEWGYEHIYPFPSAFPWPPRGTKGPGPSLEPWPHPALSTSQQEQSQEHPCIHPCPSRGCAHGTPQTPNPRPQGRTLQGSPTFWSPRSPGDTGDRHRPGAPTAVPAPAGKTAFGREGSSQTHRNPTDSGAGPRTVSLALLCPLPFSPQPCTLPSPSSSPRPARTHSCCRLLLPCPCPPQRR